MTTLRAAINWAVKRGKIVGLRVRRLEEPRDLPNPVSIEQVNSILAKAPEHLRIAILIAVHTGLRLDETLGLRWQQVDLPGRTILLQSQSTKAETGQAVFINDDLAAVLEQAPRHCDQVVAYRPRGKDAVHRPIKSLRRAWMTAQKSAGVQPPHRFHDLRATFCTAVLAANDNPMTLKEAARHASLATTLRYAKVHDQAVRTAFNATTGLIRSQTAVANTVAAPGGPATETGNETSENQQVGMARPTGLEPVTYRLEGGCSIQLS